MTDAPASWEPGTVVLRRFRSPDGRSDGVEPCRVVRDDEGGLVYWLAPGTTLVRAVLADGRPLRAVPLEERFDRVRHGRATRLDRWHGQGILGIHPPGAPWSVWLFWTETWEFRGWYVNLEAPAVRRDHELVTEDHVLDLVVHPDRRVEWKDEEELEAAVCSGRFSPEEAAQFRRNGLAAAEVAAVWGSPFCDGWERWRPDPSWSVPPLPPFLVASADYS